MLGIVLILLKGLRALKILKDLKLKFTYTVSKSVILKMILIKNYYPEMTMQKSKTFHPVLR